MSSQSIKHVLFKLIFEWFEWFWIFWIGGGDAAVHDDLCFLGAEVHDPNFMTNF